MTTQNHRKEHTQQRENWIIYFLCSSLGNVLILLWAMKICWFPLNSILCLLLKFTLNWCDIVSFVSDCSLPVPWLIYGIIYGEPVAVNSEGMVCSITILFLMLLFVIISIACFRWKMNKGLGVIMFLLYFVFVAISLSFEYNWYHCPL
jgi:hypothetical protein